MLTQTSGSGKTHQLSRSSMHYALASSLPFVTFFSSSPFLPPPPPPPALPLSTLPFNVTAHGHSSSSPVSPHTTSGSLRIYVSKWQAWISEPTTCRSCNCRPCLGQGGGTWGGCLGMNHWVTADCVRNFNWRRIILNVWFSPCVTLCG